VIFGTLERTDSEPARHGESEFQFLNRCKSIAADKIRCELERWLRDYPAEYQDELIARFRTEFYAPFFELLVHELLIRQGYSVAVHPSVGTSGKNPDFAAELPNRPEPVIVEATLCIDDQEEDSNSRRMHQVYDAIEAIDCPFYFILIRDVTLKCDAQPSSRRITSFLDRELSALDPEALLTTALEPADHRRLRFEDEVLSIDFEIAPKKREAWGRPDARNIGTFPVRMRWGDSSVAVRRTLNAKAKRYGDLDKPFVIAVNTLGPWGYDEHERLGTLFGTRQEYVPAGTEGLRVRYLTDGFWGDADSPKYTRVSAVIFGCALPVNVPRVDFCLYRNPWAAHPLPIGFWRLPTVDFSSGSAIRENTNVTVGQVLRLPDDWPGDLFPERRR